MLRSRFDIYAECDIQKERNLSFYRRKYITSHRIISFIHHHPFHLSISSICQSIHIFISRLVHHLSIIMKKIEFEIYTRTRTSNKIFITTFTLLQSAAYSSALKIIKINYGHIGKLLPPPHSRSLHSIASHRNHTYIPFSFFFFSLRTSLNVALFFYIKIILQPPTRLHRSQNRIF